MPNWNQGQQGGPPGQGDLWYNSALGQLLTYNGANWIPVSAADTEIPPTTGIVTTASDGTQTQGQGGKYISLVNGSPSFTPAIVGSGNMSTELFDPTTNRLWIYNPNSTSWKSVLLA